LGIYKTSHINKHLENHTDVNEVFLKLKNNLENRLLIFSYKSAAIIREEMLKNAWKINEKINYISNSIEDSGIFENILDDYEIIIRTDTGLTKLNSGELKIIRN
jgi:biotin-(acetyl-CoA carboxylase) ligase